MHNLWNETGMFEIEEQHLPCQVRSIFKNNRLTEIEIEQLQREIEKVEIAPERVGKVSEMSYEFEKLLENKAVIKPIILGTHQKIIVKILFTSV